MQITLDYDETEVTECSEGNVALGIAIILKYEPSTPIAARHEQLWVGDYDFTYEKMTDEGKALMEKMGWFEDEDAWSSYT
jgi:hypothetical protein